VNTREEDVDELASPRDLARWCAEHGIAGSDVELDGAALQRAIAVREALRALLFANNGHPLDTNAIRTLNDFAATVPHRLRFDAHGSKLEPAGDTLDAAVARVLLAAHEAMADGTWPRLKACRAETCGWAFYDSSKNHSAAWCSMRVCGNRQKARRYRTRRRGAPA
jgi:predicted RNA-binding Zn ribbon-like protein